MELFGLSYLTGVANFIAVAIVGLFLRFTPGIVMGYFVVTTTTVSEFVAAMERLYLPQQITIPMSVMFRFSRRWRKNGAPLGTPCGCAAYALAVERPALFWNTAWFP